MRFHSHFSTHSSAVLPWNQSPRWLPVWVKFKPLTCFKGPRFSSSEQITQTTTLWARITKNPNVSTGPLTHAFARSLALLSCSLARSLPHSWDSKWLDGYLFWVFFLFWTIVHDEIVQSDHHESCSANFTYYPSMNASYYFSWSSEMYKKAKVTCRRMGMYHSRDKKKKKHGMTCRSKLNQKGWTKKSYFWSRPAWEVWFSPGCSVCRN